jgi:hypothetical protein
MNPSTKPVYFTGLDLGQAHEFTALAVVEQSMLTPKPNEQVRHYAVRHLHRFALSTPYQAMAEYTAKLFAKPPLARSRLLVDQTIVGRPVMDMLRKAPIHASITPLTITNSQQAKGLLVPKKELVSVMQILLQTRRLTIAATLPDAAILAEELANFKIQKPLVHGEGLADWREAPHDDLVFAAAIAVWQGERTPLPGKFHGCVARPGLFGLFDNRRPRWP